MKSASQLPKVVVWWSKTTCQKMIKADFERENLTILWYWNIRDQRGSIILTRRIRKVVGWVVSTAKRKIMVPKTDYSNIQNYRKSFFQLRSLLGRECQSLHQYFWLALLSINSKSPYSSDADHKQADKHHRKSLHHSNIRQMYAKAQHLNTFNESLGRGNLPERFTPCLQLAAKRTP